MHARGRFEFADPENDNDVFFEIKNASLFILKSIYILPLKFPQMKIVYPKTLKKILKNTELSYNNV